MVQGMYWDFIKGLFEIEVMNLQCVFFKWLFFFSYIQLLDLIQEESQIYLGWSMVVR